MYICGNASPALRKACQGQCRYENGLSPR